MKKRKINSNKHSLGKNYQILFLLIFIPQVLLAKSGNFYFAGRGGITFINNPEASSSISIPFFLNAKGQASLDINKGYNIIGAFGYKVKPFRGEVEIGHSSNNLDNFKLSGSVTGYGKGGVKFNFADNSAITLTKVMGNIYYDVYLGKNIIPYLGVGFGYGHIKLKGSTKTFELTDPINVSLPSPQIELFSDSCDVFAFQIIAGLEIPINKKISITVDYRYLQTSETKFNWFFNSWVYHTHSINAGIIIKLA